MSSAELARGARQAGPDIPVSPSLASVVAALGGAARLRLVAVLRDVKQGRERLWQLEQARIDAARQTLELIGRQWEAALGRLKAFVEAP